MSTGTNKERIEQNNTLLEEIKSQIQNLPEAGGSGDVKLFATEEEMQADTTAKEGDLAIVYRNEVQNATVDSQFQVATFPNTVVLDTAITDYVDVRYSAVDSSKMFDCMGQLDSSNFMMDCYTDSCSIRIQYTSSDGITYTRTDDTGNPVDFGTEIYYEMTEYWNDAIGKFIQVDENIFEGLFEYALNVQTSKIQLRDLSSAVITVESGVASAFSVPNLIPDVVYNLNELSALLEKNDLTGGMFYLDIDNNLKYSTVRTQRYIIDGNGNIIGIGNLGSSTLSTTIYDVDLVSTTLSNPVTYAVSEFTSGSSTYSYYTITNLKSMPFFPELSTTYYGAIIVKDNSQNKWCEQVNQYIYEDMYVVAPTQLTSIADYVYEKEFYGKNGVEIGTLQNKENLTKEEVKRRVDIWANYSSGIVCPDDVSEMFYGYTNLTTIPLLDTSSVTTMYAMFQDCTNLTTIPELDTSNVTIMQNTFNYCPNLSDESLNNILAMCTNATSYTRTKTLKYIGLTSAQATKCQSLSNYSAFTSAGWTTGY